MGEDRQVLREVWEGRVPVCFSLADRDTDTLSESPQPLYLLVPRLSYFPLVLDKVRRHFVRSVPAEWQNREPWLDCDAVPLPWHQPIGLQFDMLGLDPPLPWHLTVHFSPPSQQNQDLCVTRDALEAFYLSTVKEADQLRHAGQAVSQLTRRDHNQLWAGLVSDKFDQFWSINRRLLPTSTTSGCGSGSGSGGGGSINTGHTTPSGGGERKLRCVPVRLHLPGSHFVQRPLPARFDTMSAATPATATAAAGGGATAGCSQEGDSPTLAHSGQMVTFGHVTAQLLAEAVRQQQQQQQQQGGGESEDHGYRFLLHGIEPAAETPLVWLSNNFSYADNFLHIVAIATSTTTSPPQSQQPQSTN